jgi:hypothetical protein
MAKDGLKVLDSDMHVFEPHDLYLNYCTLIPVGPMLGTPLWASRQFQKSPSDLLGQLCTVVRRFIEGPEATNEVSL